MIRSENGSNMVGASTELTHAFREMNHIKIGKSSQGCDASSRSLHLTRLVLQKALDKSPTSVQ